MLIFLQFLILAAFCLKSLLGQYASWNIPIQQDTSCITANYTDGVMINCTNLGFFTGDPISHNEVTTMYVTMLKIGPVSAIGLGERYDYNDAWCKKTDYPASGTTWASKSITQYSNCYYNMVTMYTSTASPYGSVKPKQAMVLGKTYKWTFKPQPTATAIRCYEINITMPYPDGTFTPLNESPNGICSGSKAYQYGARIMVAPYVELEGAGQSTFYVQKSLCSNISDCISCPNGDTCQICRFGYKVTDCGTCTNSTNLTCPIVTPPASNTTNSTNSTGSTNSTNNSTGSTNSTGGTNSTNSTGGSNTTEPSNPSNNSTNNTNSTGGTNSTNNSTGETNTTNPSNSTGGTNSTNSTGDTNTTNPSNSTEGTNSTNSTGGTNSTNSTGGSNTTEPSNPSNNSTNNSTGGTNSTNNSTGGSNTTEPSNPSNNSTNSTGDTNTTNPSTNSTNNSTGSTNSTGGTNSTNSTGGSNTTEPSNPSNNSTNNSTGGSNTTEPSNPSNNSTNNTNSTEGTNSTNSTGGSNTTEPSNPPNNSTNNSTGGTNSTNSTGGSNTTEPSNPSNNSTGGTNSTNNSTGGSNTTEPSNPSNNSTNNSTGGTNTTDPSGGTNTTNPSTNSTNNSTGGSNTTDPIGGKTNDTQQVSPGKTDLVTAGSQATENYASRIIILVLVVVGITALIISLLFCKKFLKAFSNRRGLKQGRKSVKVHPSPSSVSSLYPSLDLDSRKNTPKNGGITTSMGLIKEDESESMFDLTKRTRTPKSRFHNINPTLEQIKEDVSVFVLN